jgi:isoamylase
LSARIVAVVDSSAGWESGHYDAQCTTTADGRGLMNVRPGRPTPMGATPDTQGTNFAVYSASATEGAISLCLFADDGTETRLPVTARTGDVWHTYVPGIGAGQHYGYRVNGPWNPAGGKWANEAKLLLDPWSKAIDGGYDGDSAAVAHMPNNHTSPDPRDSAPHVPRSVVVDPTFDWGDDTPPRIALADSVIYETHVRGLAKLHPQVPDAQKGTYAGLASDPIVTHLTSLGITAVELMPVHQFLPAATPVAPGLTDYWGYMSVGFFAPHAAYCSAGTRGQQVNEFKSMVKALHRAGIEVVLDVVYNHSGEGNADGPSVVFRGFDNPTYYWLEKNDPSNYYDYSGTGNTLDAGQPEVLRLILSSLRYWVTEMHVDGFRFDLAAILARQEGNIDKFAAFLDLVYQDPVISQVKLIAEPWDANGGYVLGQFPPPWGQWNDHYRSTVRDFWRAQAGIGALATRLAGSGDVFAAADQSPESSVNLVTCHDGFTLTDLVSYNSKHNDANGHENSDGSDDNRSWNCGAEGPSTDAGIVALRAQQRRNFLATLLISQGVPMIQGGDEIGRTQQGNNNDLLPGQTRQLVRLGPRPRPPRSARVHHPRDWNPQGAPRVSEAQLSHWPAAPAGQRRGRGLVVDRWHTHDTRHLELGIAGLRRLAQRRSTHRHRCGREGDHRRHVLHLVQRLLEPTGLLPAAAQPRQCVDTSTGHHPAHGVPRAGGEGAGRRLDVQPWCSKPARAA